MPAVKTLAKGQIVIPANLQRQGTCQLPNFEIPVSLHRPLLPHASHACLLACQPCSRFSGHSAFGIWARTFVRLRQLWLPSFFPPHHPP